MSIDGDVINISDMNKLYTTNKSIGLSSSEYEVYTGFYLSAILKYEDNNGIQVRHMRSLKDVWANLIHKYTGSYPDNVDILNKEVIIDFENGCMWVDDTRYNLEDDGSNTHTGYPMSMIMGTAFAYDA